MNEVNTGINILNTNTLQHKCHDILYCPSEEVLINLLFIVLVSIHRLRLLWQLSLLLNPTSDRST